MERLKALLYCLRCHLVLLIFVGLATGGYWLRADLYRQFGLDSRPELESAVSSASSEQALTSAKPLPAEPQPASIEVERPQVQPAPTLAEPKAMTTRIPSARELAAAGNFDFRPLDATQSGPPSDLPGRQELLTQARRAYWNGDIRTAVRGYQRLIEAYPDQPDYLGELGNIYYEQGADQLAASFYLDSARLLLERGERSRVEVLAKTLDGLDARAAAELRGRLAGASGVTE